MDRSGLLLGGRYRVQSLLAVGGSGSVWLAEHLALRRLVVAKFHEASWTGAAGSTALARFMREARTLSAVRHRNVIQLHEVGKTESGEPYLILERLRGESLAERIGREGNLPIDVALGIARALCDGLEAVHAAGVIHRDVKPENIVLHEDDVAAGEVTPKLLDFGIARAMTTVTSITSTGAAIGTPGYMAPEQARGSSLDARADLYSLGVTLYEMLSGELPFEGESMAELLIANAEREPIPLSVWGPDLCGPLADGVMKALAPSPEDRYPDARAMRHAIRALLGDRKGSYRAGRPRTGPPRHPEQALLARTVARLDAGSVARKVAPEGRRRARSTTPPPGR